MDVLFERIPHVLTNHRRSQKPPSLIRCTSFVVALVEARAVPKQASTPNIHLITRLADIVFVRRARVNRGCKTVDRDPKNFPISRTMGFDPQRIPKSRFWLLSELPRDDDVFFFVAMATTVTTTRSIILRKRVLVLLHILFFTCWLVNLYFMAMSSALSFLHKGVVLSCLVWFVCEACERVSYRSLFA